MIIRWAIYFAFFAVVAATSLSRCHQLAVLPHESFWRAPRDLQLNTRISTNYLEKWHGSAPVNSWGMTDAGEMEGKFVVGTNIPGGSEIALSNLSPLPRPMKTNGYVMRFYSMQDLGTNFPRGYVNAGATIRISDKDVTNLPNPCDATVAIVLGNNDPLTLAVLVTNSAATDLDKVTKPKLQLLDANWSMPWTNTFGEN